MNISRQTFKSCHMRDVRHGCGSDVSSLLHPAKHGCIHYRNALRMHASLRFRAKGDTASSPNSRHRFILSTTLLGLFLFASFLVAMAEGGEINSFANPLPPALTSSRQLAILHEQAGCKREVATLNEEMARTYTVARKVLARRLVTICSETDETDKALAWAHEVMRENPDPRASGCCPHAARSGQSGTGII